MWTILNFAIIISVHNLNFVGANMKEFEQEKFDNGKSQYSLIKQQTKMPKFGQCWLSAITLTEQTCTELTDESQTRLALSYLNCFLEIQGRETYPCLQRQSLRDCTSNMKDSDQSSFTTFFTHANNICYFLQSQAWHEKTENTISRLADKSEDVADQLEVSSSLQKEMMLHQNTSISNQKLLIDQAQNLSLVLSNSSVNINDMFNEFNRTTREQRNLIMDVFDRLAKLQSLVLGEFSGFYSLIFYFLSIVISYFLTSTQRTHSARFWLFGIMTVDILLERLIFSLGQAAAGGDTGKDMVNESVVYSRQWLCREICCTMGLVVLFVCAYRFKDLNVINNHLLVEIRKQNSDLKRLLVSGHSPGRPSTPTYEDRQIATPSTPTTPLHRSFSTPSTPLNNPFATPAKIHYPSRSTPSSIPSTPRDSLGYHSGSESSTDSDCSSSDSDRTFVYTDSQHGDIDTSDSESYRTVSRGSSSRSNSSRSSTPSMSRSSTPTMMDELAALRDTTPFRELISAVWSSGDNEATNTHPLSQSCSPSKLSQSTVDYRPGLERYNLRNRRSPNTNPTIQQETAKEFSKTVHHLAKVATKNSMLVRFTKTQEARLGHSSDEETRL